MFIISFIQNIVSPHNSLTTFYLQASVICLAYQGLGFYISLSLLFDIIKRVIPKKLNSCSVTNLYKALQGMNSKSPAKMIYESLGNFYLIKLTAYKKAYNCPS